MNTSTSKAKRAPSSSVIRVATESAAETRKIGEALGRELKSAALGRAIIIAFKGELGTGKTVFIQGIGKGLGIKSIITSPTFVLARKHPGSVSLIHIDAYRITNRREADIFTRGLLAIPRSVVCVEWHERIAHIARPDITVAITHLAGNRRKLIIKAQ